MTSYPYFVYIRSDAPCTEIRCSFRFPGDDTAQSYSPLSTLILRAIAMEGARTPCGVSTTSFLRGSVDCGCRWQERASEHRKKGIWVETREQCSQLIWNAAIIETRNLGLRVAHYQNRNAALGFQERKFCHTKEEILFNTSSHLQQLDKSDCFFC